MSLRRASAPTRAVWHLKGKHILLISPESWHGLKMSKHHLAEGLVARGNHVCFWGTSPASTREVAVTGEGALRVVNTPHWFRSINHWPKWVNQWYYGRTIAAIEREAGSPFDIIWCFDTSRMQWFAPGPFFKLLHLVDYNVLHQGHGLMRSADIILTTADIINKRVLELAPHAHVFKVGHALDRRWLADSDGLATARSGAPRTALYAGQFYNTYIDFEVLVNVAQAHPRITFTYVGPFDPHYDNPWFQRLRTLPNVTFTGLKNKDELLPLVRQADILLFCFMTEKRMLERANPHKVLEYLSTGNIIVGTWTLEYETHQQLLLMAPGPSDFVSRFQEAVDRFGELNTTEKRTERIAFARERTVEHVLDRIATLVREATKGKA